MSESITIYHNPRCSKSRQTLALIEQQGITPEIVLYLESPPTPAKLKKLLKALNISARELLRKGEQQYKDLGLADASISDTVIISTMCENPKLIERPIVVKGNNAVLGRPPENVLELI